MPTLAASASPSFAQVAWGVKQGGQLTVTGLAMAGKVTSGRVRVWLQLCTMARAIHRLPCPPHPALPAVQRTAATLELERVNLFTSDAKVQIMGGRGSGRTVRVGGQRRAVECARNISRAQSGMRLPACSCR